MPQAQPNEPILIIQFYGLFKQANDGDCTGPRPGMMDFTGKYKYDAWKKLEGMSKEDAQKKYVELLEEVSFAFSFNVNAYLVALHRATL